MRIVLVHPRDPNNIGAAARAMANFGLTDLVLVAPYDPSWREARSAIGAAGILRSARVVDTFEQAIADCTFVGATTAGSRRLLANSVSPDQFLTEAADHDNCALVFGNEKHGLSASVISACHLTVTIPTSESQPSINLGQAVAICCYLFSATRVDRRPSIQVHLEPATVARIDELIAVTMPPADDVVVESQRQRARAMLRALLLRSRATDSELALLRGLVAPGRRLTR